MRCGILFNDFCTTLGCLWSDMEFTRYDLVGNSQLWRDVVFSSMTYALPWDACGQKWNSQGMIWVVAWDFQQCGILTCVDSDERRHHPFKLRNSKWCSVSSLTLIEYSNDWQRLWSDCVYAQADLRLCWLHITYCWKSHLVGNRHWLI